MRLSAQPTTDLHQKAAGSPASPPEPMSLAQWLASGEWFIHANGSYDICGDWQHSGSWAGSRQLGSDPDAPHYYITIHGRLRSGSFGRVPYMWSAKLVLGDMWITIPTTHPSCKSVADACHQADRALTPEAFGMACEAFYQHSRVQCMARIENGRLQPFLSSFGDYPIMSSGIWPRMILAPGIYVVAWRRAGQVKHTRYDVSWHGYSGSPAAPEHRFAPWLLAQEIHQAQEAAHA